MAGHGGCSPGKRIGTAEKAPWLGAASESPLSARSGLFASQDEPSTVYFCLVSYSSPCIYGRRLNRDDCTAPMRPSRLPIGKPLILCVDDDFTQLKLRQAVLEEDGFNVLCATNVADAIATFREAPVCCTSAGHLLQGQSRTDLAKELKSIKHDVPIILYSGAMPRNLQNIDVYINKGESTSEFVRLVREVVRRFCT